MKKIFYFTLITATCFLAGCFPNYKQEFLKNIKDQKWTKEQELAALYDSYRFAGKKNPDGSYSLNQNIISKTKVLKQLETYAEDLDYLLSFQSDLWNKHMNTHGLYPQFEQEEQIVQEALARIKMSVLNDDFKKEVGDAPIINNDEVKAKLLGYNPVIFYYPNVLSVFPFTLDEVTDARIKGTLKLVESSTLVFSRKFDTKDKDPSDPADQNKFVWKSKELSLKLNTYKILTSADQPQDNEPNYIEGYRVNNGVEEILPALKIFFVSGKAVMVIDTDRFAEPGYGLPDLIKVSYGVESVYDILSDKSFVRDLLFKDKIVEKRIPPIVKPVKIQIARVGENKIDLWEDAPDEKGWMVPVKYWNDTKNNYKVDIKFKEIDDKSASNLQEIDMFKKIYSGGSGDVVEYYKPKAEFQGKVIECKVTDNDKRLLIQLENGKEITGVVTATDNQFIEESPVAIDYNEGGKRWRIKKVDNSTVFNKRREIALN